MDRKRRTIGQVQQQAQHGGRGLGLRGAGAQHEKQFVVFCSGPLQTTQLFGAHLRQPGQDRIHRSAAQRLLAQPQGGRALAVRRAQPEQALRLQTLGLQGGRKRQIGRRHQYHRAAATARQRGQ